MDGITYEGEQISNNELDGGMSWMEEGVGWRNELDGGRSWME